MLDLTPTEHNFILLLHSALTDRTAELPADADIESILHLAADHKLYHMILSAMPADRLPEPQNRRTALLGQVTAQVNAANAFLNLWTDMTDAGFHPLVVKGLVCRSLYSKPELRPSVTVNSPPTLPDTPTHGKITPTIPAKCDRLRCST